MDSTEYTHSDADYGKRREHFMCEQAGRRGGAWGTDLRNAVTQAAENLVDEGRATVT